MNFESHKKANILKIKLYLNENLSTQIALRLRDDGYDVVSSHETGMNAKDDYEQMKYAISQERAIVSINHKDFITIYSEYNENNKEHFGIILSTDENHWLIYKRLLNLLTTLETDTLKNNLRWLNDFK